MKLTPALQFQTQTSQNWINYFANVGGAFGLCLGFSITTLAELIWLTLMIIFKAIKVYMIKRNIVRTVVNVWNRAINLLCKSLLINNRN